MARYTDIFNICVLGTHKKKEHWVWYQNLCSFLYLKKLQIMFSHLSSIRNWKCYKTLLLFDLLCFFQWLILSHQNSKLRTLSLTIKNQTISYGNSSLACVKFSAAKSTNFAIFYISYCYTFPLSPFLSLSLFLFRILIYWNSGEYKRNKS